MVLAFANSIKILAGISIIMSIILLGGASWVFGTQMIDFDQKLNSFGLLNTHHSESAEEYNDIMKNLKFVWEKNQPILRTSSAIALFCGFFQLVVSLHIIFSDSKNIRKRTRIWLITHFVLFLVLLVCILSTFLMRLNHGMNNKSFSEIISSFEEILKKNHPKKDYRQAIHFLRTSTQLYYGTVGSDQVSTIILFFGGVYIMHNYNDYEPQD